MNQIIEKRNQLIALIDRFEHMKHQLQDLPAVGTKDLVFADVVLLNKTESDPTEGSFYSRRLVRTDIPQVFIWLFKQFASIFRDLPGYGIHKEEIFGRLGNTLAMVEGLEPPATSEEKVAAVMQDFWEICQDLIEGRVQSFSVALGAEVLDDFVSRAIKSGYINQESFEKELFGEEL